ncbi:MAG: hypothetical protein PF693_05760 [Spirochaetia bacterium]|jgi:hypothetical protein|nr:hypothetical protein [Spirochaetia bacterium]
MDEYFSEVSEEVQNHLKQLVGSVNLPSGADALEVLAKAWLEKEKVFMSQIRERNLEEADEFSVEEPRGALLMTYSGSLLTLGPISEDGRKVEYASVGLRSDVPDSAEKDGSVLSSDVSVGGSAEFLLGPIKKSSPVYKIAVVREEMPLEEEEEFLSEVTQIMADDFVEINKTLIIE